MLVALTAAAAYYNLPKLCDTVNSVIQQEYVKKLPTLSLAVLEACAQERPAISNNLLELALTNVRHNKFDVLNQGVLGSLSSPVLTQILSDEKSLVTEYKRFKMVHLWSQGASEREENRLEVAKMLVKKHLKLQFINPEALSNSVAPSGLVDIQHLAEAYKQQAIKAKRTFGASFEKPFCLPEPVWIGSNSNRFDLPYSSWKSDKLASPTLVNGCKYEWTINTEMPQSYYSQNNSIMIGIAKSSAVFNDGEHCGQQASCWAFSGYNGQVWECGSNTGEVRSASRNASRFPLRLISEERHCVGLKE
eukprot:Sro1732_g294141.1  (305) ;mRNA; r:3190-4104